MLEMLPCSAVQGRAGLQASWYLSDRVRPTGDESLDGPGLASAPLAAVEGVETRVGSQVVLIEDVVGCAGDDARARTVDIRLVAAHLGAVAVAGARGGAEAAAVPPHKEVDDEVEEEAGGEEDQDPAHRHAHPHLHLLPLCTRSCRLCDSEPWRFSTCTW